jgi:hypothetical protein
VREAWVSAGTSDSGYMYGATREERGSPVSHAAHSEPPLYYGLPVRGLDRVPAGPDSRAQEYYPQPHASPSHRPRAEPASSSSAHQNPNSTSAPSPRLRQQTRAAAQQPPASSSPRSSPRATAPRSGSDHAPPPPRSPSSSASRLFSWLHNVPGVDEMRRSLRRVYLSQQHTQGTASHSHAPMHEPPRMRPTNVFESCRSPANPFVAAAEPGRPQGHHAPRPRSPRLFSIRSRGASHEGVREALEQLLGGLAAEEGVDVTMEEIAPDGLLGLDPHLVTPALRPRPEHHDAEADDAGPPPYDINAPVTVYPGGQRAPPPPPQTSSSSSPPSRRNDSRPRDGEWVPLEEVLRCAEHLQWDAEAARREAAEGREKLDRLQRELRLAYGDEKALKLLSEPELHELCQVRARCPTSPSNNITTQRSSSAFQVQCSVITAT